MVIIAEYEYAESALLIICQRTENLLEQSAEAPIIF